MKQSERVLSHQPLSAFWYTSVGIRGWLGFLGVRYFRQGNGLLQMFGAQHTVILRCNAHTSCPNTYVFIALFVCEDRQPYLQLLIPNLYTSAVVTTSYWPSHLEPCVLFILRHLCWRCKVISSPSTLHLRHCLKLKP